MTLLANIDTDFVFVLADFGEAVTFAHKTVQTLNTTTGQFATTEQSQALTAVVSELETRDREIVPDSMRVDARVFRFRVSDLDVAVANGDTITYGAQNFKIIETSKQKNGVYRVIAERVQ